MVKTVVSNKEIAHLWGKQDYARGSNCHFEGNLFYSYSAEIGALRTNDKCDVAAFIDISRYSNTTTRHQSNLEGAVNHLTTFTYNPKPVNYYHRYREVYPSTVTPDWL